MKIVAIDPGVTTGWCFVELLFNPLMYAIIDQGEIKDEPELVGKKLAALEADFWVIEQFMLISLYAVEVSHNDPYLNTVQVIGSLKTLIDPSKRVFQTPSTKKATPDEVLKDLGLWHGSRHTRDALRHVVYFSKGLMNDKPFKHKKIEELARKHYGEWPTK